MGRWALCVLALGGVLPPQALRGQTARPSPAVGGEVSPPVAIAGLDARPSVPLEFSRAWLAKAERVRRHRAELRAAGKLDGEAPEALVEMGAALAGVLRVPVIPVRYEDVTAPFSNTVLADRLFGPVRGDTASYASYWREVSGGLLTVEGEVAPWVKLSEKASHYLPREAYAWTSFGRIAEFRTEALRKADEHLDYGRFDNDGPDGTPNSGDDDGFVDFVALVYATRCKGDWRDGAIWPHRGAMAPFETRDRAANGGRIKVTDYVVLPAVEPGTCDPLQIGVLAHETGHVLGLPDLYDYDGTSQGIGAWGLMGTGSHSARHSPAHPSAWEKEQLGWVRVVGLTADQTGLEIPPVLESRTAYRYDLPTRNQYLLLENRQRLGSDAHLPGTGLLVWRIDPDRGELGAWNGDERSMAVALVQADGRDDLSRGRVADAGDPYPGAAARHALEIPGERPFRLTGISEQAGKIVADLAIGFAGPALVVSPSEVRLAALAEDSAFSRVLAVRREGGALGEWAASGSASWLATRRFGDALVLRADPAGLAPGTYADTVELALVGREGVAGQVAVRLSIVAPGLPEVIATGLPWSWGLAAQSGRVFQAGYGWDPLGLRPRPRLLHLRDSEVHAETLARLPAEALYAPVPARGGGVYVLARAQEDTYLYRVAPDGAAEVVATGLGAAPAYGAAALRDGSVLVADWSGRIQRVDPSGEVQPWTHLGARIYQIATDTAGTIYAAGYTGNVLRVDTQGRLSELQTGFDPGRLVAVAATPGGDVFAAERGDGGRILRISPDGTRQVVGRIPGAEFYGLAVDDRFLYALDLRHRQLLRFALEGGPARVAASAASPASAPDAETR